MTFIFDLIVRMNVDDPSWGEDEIFAECDLTFSFEHSTSTIRECLVRRPLPGDHESQTKSTRAKPPRSHSS